MLTKEIKLPPSTSGFIYPQYKTKCISNIPNLVLNIFHTKKKQSISPLTTQLEMDLKGINKVILLVLDGFGFKQFVQHYIENPFLLNLTDLGQVFPITSIYPSQTTNALTTLNTGLTPQEHGIFEYFIYLKETGIINALQFERVYTKNRCKLIDQGYDPHIMFSGENIQQKLKKESVKTFTHMNESNVSNACTKLVFEGSTIIPSHKTSDAIVKLRKNVEKNSGSAYFFVHLETLDAISHEYGPESEEYKAELQAISYLLQKELVEKISIKAAKETLILMTADHGGIQVDPGNTTYLSLGSEAIKHAKIGIYREKILPTGSPRDIFLHVKENKVSITKEALLKSIGDKAQIIETKEAIKAGLFGTGAISSDFVERTGNLQVLPYGKETIWFEHRSGRKINLRGQHGGLNPDEMLVPFAAVNLDSLKK
jgi:hypothetical protein